MNEHLHIMEFWNEPVSYRVEVIKEGNCRANHKKGQSFIFDIHTPDGLCGESFVGMYPLLHSLKVLGDMRELGSPERNVRRYTCPSGVIQFQVKAIYRCNLCGQPLRIKNGEIVAKRLENKENGLWVRVCSNCFEKHQHKILEW